jgi:hypothetical protein
MSTSSCPQCGKQVTIPAGVSTTAKVRCPLCHSQYRLADALVNMPPLLELVDEDGDAALDLGVSTAPQGTPLAVPPDILPAASAVPASGDLDDLSLDDFGSSQPDEHEEVELSADLGQEDLTVEEKDTEVEELGFAAAEAEAPRFDEDMQAAGSATADEDVLDFGEALPLEPTGDAPAELPAAAGPEDELALDFGGPARGDEDVEIQFEDELSPQAFGGPEEGTDLSSSAASDMDEDEEFAQALEASQTAEAGGAGDELALDFGEPIEVEDTPGGVAPVAAADETPDDEQPSGKKKKKKKAKADSAGEPRRRRPLSTALSVLLGAIVGLPLALYIMLWLGPDYDFLGIAQYLPKAVLPKALSGPKYASANRPVSQPQIPVLPPASSGEPERTTPAADAAQPAAEPAANEVPSAAPSAEPANAPVAATPPSADTAPPSPGPAAAAADAAPARETPGEQPAAAPEEDPFATSQPKAEPEPSAPAESKPAEEPSPPAAAAAPAKSSLDELFPEDKPADEMPDENPNETPAEAPAAAPTPAAPTPAATKPADDPFSTPAEPNELPVPADAATPAEPAPAEVVGPKNAVPVSLAQLITAMQNAEAADRQMVAAQGSASEAQMKTIRSNFYLSFFRLADAVTLVKDEGGQLADVRGLLQQFLLRFAADPKRVDALKFNADRWLGFPRRTTPGVMLAGKVQSAQASGKLFETKIGIGLESDAPIVTVLTATDPKLSAGDQVLALGTIVDSPAEHLAAYTGSESKVVWSGMVLKLPARP